MSIIIVVTSVKVLGELPVVITHCNISSLVIAHLGTSVFSLY